MAQTRKVTSPAGHDLVDVCLVACVPDDRVLRTVEYSVQRERELDHAEVGGEMAARSGRLFDQEGAHLAGKLCQPALVELAEVGG